MSLVAQTPRRPSFLALLITSILSAVLLFGAAAVEGPAVALGATTTKVAVCKTNLRTSATTTARLRASIRAGTKVSVVATVRGGRWHTKCGGTSSTGRGWYRIKAIGGKSVKSLYGVTYLYAARSLLKTYVPPAVTRYAACRTNLRTSASVSSSSKATITTDTRVLVAATVSGGAWSTTCAGNAVSGTTWYRITRIGDETVQARYGVASLYAASGLFSATARVSTAPTPTPAPTPSPDPDATPTPSPTPNAFAGMTEGLDISHWQGSIDWTRVAAAGKKFVFMKASEDWDYVDPTYVWNRQQARAVGLYVGAYHFAQPKTTAGDAVAEADHFVDTALPVAGDLLPVLDLERTGGLTQTALTAWVKAYLDRVYQRLGVRAVIYASPNFWKTYMGDSTWFSANGYDFLWVAHWTAGTAPLVPGSNWGGDGWTFWQYTSDGSVPGISGRVDLNRYQGTDFTKVLIP